MKINVFFQFVSLDALYVPVNTFFRKIGTFPGLNQYQSNDKVSCSGAQHIAFGETQTRHLDFKLRTLPVNPVNIKKWVTVSTPAKRHLNGVSLVSRWWPDTVCWLGSHCTPLSDFKPQILINAKKLLYCTNLYANFQQRALQPRK